MGNLICAQPQKKYKGGDIDQKTDKSAVKKLSKLKSSILKKKKETKSGELKQDDCEGNEGKDISDENFAETYRQKKLLHQSSISTVAQQGTRPKKLQHSQKQEQNLRQRNNENTSTFQTTEPKESEKFISTRSKDRYIYTPSTLGSYPNNVRREQPSTSLKTKTLSSGLKATTFIAQNHVNQLIGALTPKNISGVDRKENVLPTSKRMYIKDINEADSLLNTDPRATHASRNNGQTSIDIETGGSVLANDNIVVDTLPAKMTAESCVIEMNCSSPRRQTSEMKSFVEEKIASPADGPLNHTSWCYNTPAPLKNDQNLSKTSDLKQDVPSKIIKDLDINRYTGRNGSEYVALSKQPLNIPKVDATSPESFMKEPYLEYYLSNPAFSSINRPDISEYSSEDNFASFKSHLYIQDNIKNVPAKPKRHFTTQTEENLERVSSLNDPRSLRTNHNNVINTKLDDTSINVVHQVSTSNELEEGNTDLKSHEESSYRVGFGTVTNNGKFKYMTYQEASLINNSKPSDLPNQHHHSKGNLTTSTESDLKSISLVRKSDQYLQSLQNIPKEPISNQTSINKSIKTAEDGVEHLIEEKSLCETKDMQATKNKFLFNMLDQEETIPTDNLLCDSNTDIKYEDLIREDIFPSKGSENTNNSKLYQETEIDFCVNTAEKLHRTNQMESNINNFSLPSAPKLEFNSFPSIPDDESCSHKHSKPLNNTRVNDDFKNQWLHKQGLSKNQTQPEQKEQMGKANSTLQIENIEDILKHPENESNTFVSESDKDIIGEYCLMHTKSEESRKVGTGGMNSCIDRAAKLKETEQLSTCKNRNRKSSQSLTKTKSRQSQQTVNRIQDNKNDTYISLEHLKTIVKDSSTISQSYEENEMPSLISFERNRNNAQKIGESLSTGLATDGEIDKRSYIPEPNDKSEIIEQFSKLSYNTEANAEIEEAETQHTSIDKSIKLREETNTYLFNESAITVVDKIIGQIVKNTFEDGQTTQNNELATINLASITKHENVQEREGTTKNEETNHLLNRETGVLISDETYNKVIESLTEIRRKAEPFQKEIDNFTELEDSNKHYYIEESLRRLVDKLDDMFDDIGDVKMLREKRKEVYRLIFPLFERLDAKVNENRLRIQSENLER